MKHPRLLLLTCVVFFFPFTASARDPGKPPHTPACGNWEFVFSPNPNSGPVFSGVTAVPGTNEVWSVGSYIFNYWLTLTEHWDGTSWQIVASPNISNANHYVYGVAAIAANDVWAVGRYEPQGGGSRTLVFHWDGTSWNIIPSPNPATYNGLYAVSAASTNDVWAVGYYYSDSGQRTLVEHWDGSSWSIVPSENVGTHDNLLRAVSVIPNSQMFWAVGYYYRDDGNPSTLIQRWDGSEWTVVTSPDGSTRENYLTGVSSTGPNDAWAVGYYNTPTGLYLSLTEHWDGSSWQIVPSPSVSSSLTALSGVSSITPNDVWAVGSYFNDNAAQLTLAQHWDGISWQVFPTPNPAGTDTDEAINVFTAVANVPRVGVWALGYYQRLGTPSQTLTAFYCPTGVPSPTPTMTPGATATPTPTATPAITPTATPSATVEPHPRPTPRARPTPPPRP